jgi:hypothetical protein
MRIIVKLRYRLFQRSNGIFFIEDRVTGKQASLQTRDKVAAQRIFNAKTNLISSRRSTCKSPARSESGPTATSRPHASYCGHLNVVTAEMIAA